MEKYRDIINLPRPVSKKRRPMAIGDRAAQFAPFAALTGHEKAVEEVARLTEDRIELDQYMKDDINRKLQLLLDRVKERPEVEILYFQADHRKEDGRYLQLKAKLKKIDIYEKLLIMDNLTEITIDNIIKLDF
ncbi:hypothetical protein [Tissierella pigra]|uniref:YolD-like family protein n=1 Tax=Tissierella pigra TaxID=2607614 RepID=A0A6N7XXD6_9FIRM|nr:hypothetical protein [Tissierella pigra]MSU02113.1 hypothetical protein [Tissierella pigra]